MPAEDFITHLYKFRSLATDFEKFTERILTHNELYFSAPAAFNDPFDCLPVLSASASNEEFLKHMEDVFDRCFPIMSRQDRDTCTQIALEKHQSTSNSSEEIERLNEVMKQITNTVGVLSLARNPDHILMWSHYADSHRGVCFRFKASSTTPFFGRAQSVSYQAERPIVNLFRDPPYKQVNRALLTKADIWSYEKEWRVIEHNLGPGAYKFPQALLDGIIFGARTEPSHKAKISELVKGGNSSIKLYEARISSKLFGVEINEI